MPCAVAGQCLVDCTIFAGAEREARSRCPHSSVVEHFLGKEEVIGSIPIVGSINS